MASAIDADLRQLKMFSVYERFDKAISTGDIYDELSGDCAKSWIIIVKRN